MNTSNPYAALNEAHQRLHKEQEQGDSRPSQDVTAQPTTTKNEYHKTLDRIEDRRERAARAIFDQDEQAQAQIRQEMADAGLRGYEINSEFERADEQARQRLASEQERGPEQTNQQQELSREAEKQRFLAQRSAQRAQDREQSRDIGD